MATPTDSSSRHVKY